MAAMCISNDEGEDYTSKAPPPTNASEIITSSLPPTNEDVPMEEKFITTDFSTNPHVIPLKEDPLLQQSDQALPMTYHEQLSHCSFNQLKQLVEKGIILCKLTKVPTLECPSCLYGKAH